MQKVLVLFIANNANTPSQQLSRIGPAEISLFRYFKLPLINNNPIIFTLSFLVQGLLWFSSPCICHPPPHPPAGNVLSSSILRLER